MNGTQLLLLLEFLHDLAQSDRNLDASSDEEVTFADTKEIPQVTPEELPPREGTVSQDDEDMGYRFPVDTEDTSSPETEDEGGKEEKPECHVVLALVFAHWCPFSASMRKVIEGVVARLPHVVAVAVEKATLRPR